MRHFAVKIFFLSIIILLSFSIFQKVNAQEVNAQATTTATTTQEQITPQQIQQLIKGLQDIITARAATFFVNFTPTNPSPNTLVSAQVISYTFDVDRASIVWLINGKKVASGKNFSFTTGDAGSRLTLYVSIVTAEGLELSKTFFYQAVGVDLLWEAQTYTPFSYRGKALAAPQSPVKVIALPQGASVSNSALLYEWSRNGKKIAASSGLGKNILNFYTSEAGQDIIAVKISNADQSLMAENQTAIAINAPKILFYENLALEGPQYQKELGNVFSLGEKEFIIRAEPFFFSKRALPLLSYAWTMNNKNIETPKKPNVLNLTAPSGAKGSSLIQLSLQNYQNVLEMAEKTLQINFGGQ